MDDKYDIVVVGAGEFHYYFLSRRGQVTDMGHLQVGSAWPQRKRSHS